MPLPPLFPLRRAGTLPAPNTSHHSVSLPGHCLEGTHILLTPFLLPFSICWAPTHPLMCQSNLPSKEAVFPMSSGRAEAFLLWLSVSVPGHTLNLRFLSRHLAQPWVFTVQVNRTNRRAEWTINSYSICQAPRVLFHSIVHCGSLLPKPIPTSVFTTNQWER